MQASTVGAAVGRHGAMLLRGMSCEDSGNWLTAARAEVKVAFEPPDRDTPEARAARNSADHRNVVWQRARDLAARPVLAGR
jgi:hypothetical protein